MSKLVWDESGSRYYETGVSNGVLFPMGDDGTGYESGVAWNGLINVTDSPEGAEATDLYADGIKYASFRSTETFKFSIEAYAYPEEFAVCDGTASPIKGMYIGQQARRPFAFCYRSEKGNDTSSSPTSYILHLIYNATASPTEKSHDTINDSPDAATFSWDCETTSINVTGYKPTAEIRLDSAIIGAEKMAKIEAKLYGDTSAEPTMPSPDEVIALLKAA